MAIAKKCDICGKLYEIYNVVKDVDNVNGLMYLNIDAKGNYYSHGRIDCCPKCMKSIKNHIDMLRNAGLENKVVSSDDI